MCGIAGILAYGHASQVNREELIRIRDNMPARGPDGHGLWLNEDQRLGLAHRRLSILDLSDNAAQPMPSSSGNSVITFNGEIYNFSELRAGLEAKGHSFRSTGDSEVLLQLYEDRGERMLDELRGMFAFAIWDRKRRRLFLARDPYGIKPLYYADDGRCFRFASQVKALVAGGVISTAVDPAGVVGFLLTGSVPEPFTIRRAVKSLGAGEYMFVGADGPGRATRYYAFGAQLHEKSATAKPVTQAMVREALRDTIAAHQVSDVPVGVFLSAGIDSGAILSLMHESAHGAIQAITVAFSEFAGTAKDEAQLARVVADQHGAQHHVHTVDYAEFESELPLILEGMDQPSIDGTNTWFVSKAARQAGLKVCMSGVGGDELFGGYESFRDIPKWVRRSAWLPAPARTQVAAGLLFGIARNLHVPIHPKAIGLVGLGATYPGAWLVRRGLFMPWELPSIIDPAMAQQGLAELSLLNRIGAMLDPDPGTPFGRVMVLESELYMRNQLLRDADWAGMGHSIEIRTPFVDRLLFEALAPSLAATEGSKKQMIAGSLKAPLPTEVAGRAKSGFNVPISAWLDRARTRLLPTPAKDNPNAHWSRRWALQMLTPLVA